MSTNNKKHADPMKTKNGKARLGPLSYEKLEEMLKSAQPKNRSKILNRMNTLVKKFGYVSKVKEVPEEATAE